MAMEIQEACKKNTMADVVSSKVVEEEEGKSKSKMGKGIPTISIFFIISWIHKLFLFWRRRRRADVELLLPQWNSRVGLELRRKHAGGLGKGQGAIHPNTVDGAGAPGTDLQAHCCKCFCPFQLAPPHQEKPPSMGYYLFYSAHLCL
uniref:Uncharacterized protein n=1 Tax=Oryza glumipatula TaxID=40148 RepID=A0A0E0BK67_9ORYZ